MVAAGPTTNQEAARGAWRAAAAPFCTLRRAPQAMEESPSPLRISWPSSTAELLGAVLIGSSLCGLRCSLRAMTAKDATSATPSTKKGEKPPLRRLVGLDRFRAWLDRCKRGGGGLLRGGKPLDIGARVVPTAVAWRAADHDRRAECGERGGLGLGLGGGGERGGEGRSVEREPCLPDEQVA